jgi:hypothetical protein
MDGSVGNILQTQFTISDSTYILGVNYVWKIFHTDPFIPEYILNHSLSIVFEEYFLQTHPPHNICWTAHCQLYLKYISYRAFHPRIYHIFWDGWVSRKYFSNTIDNQRFNIYSGMDCSVGNILQTQLTMSDSTYILGWKALYEI